MPQKCQIIPLPLFIITPPLQGTIVMSTRRLTTHSIGLAILILFQSISHYEIIFAQTTPEITAWKLNKTGTTGYGGNPADIQKVQYSTNYVYVNASGIPSYTIGTWAMNPNTAANKNWVFKIPRNPQPRSGTKVTVGLGKIGVFVNGVPMYNADDGMSYNNNQTWKRNAYYFEKVSFDACSGHPDQSSTYHHHIYPTCLQAIDASKHSALVGFSFDGYPVYGPYAYANTNGTGGLKRMTPSYQKRNITTRTTLPGSTTVLAASLQGPVVSTQYPLGCFLQDYEFIQGSGDLDAYNGRFAVTPEYPNGVYAYYVTVDADHIPVYPFILGLQYYGTPETASISGNANPTEAVTEYTGTVATPGASISLTSLAFGSTTVGMNKVLSYTISASNLASNVAITAPTGFGLSTTQNGSFTQTLTLTPASGTVTQTTVFVRFAPTQSGSFTGNITHSSGTTSFANIALKASATPVGVQSGNDAGVRIFPNPANTLITVQVPVQQSVQVSISLRNALGQTLLSVQETQPAYGVFSKNLDLTNFPAGVYFVEVQRGQQSIIEKVIKQ